ncbi:MAG TPA: CHASE4 domain-containing protein, partial [bacterium]|nr:CHASE4 domain-containing protein [bacterium]
MVLIRIRSRWLVAAGAVAALVGLVAAAAQLFFLPSFAAIERADTLQHIQRVTDALRDDLRELERQAADWAAWDDTYAFVTTRDPTYVTSNLPNATYADLRLNLFLLYDRTARLVYGRGFDLESGRQRGLPPSIDSHLTPQSPLLRHLTVDSSVAGLLLLPEGPMLVVSRPILTSERQGPIRGTLIWGRFLSRWEIRRLGELTQVDLSAAPASNGARLSPADLEVTHRGGIVRHVEPVDRHWIAAVAVVPDIYRQPGLLLRIVVERDIMAQGRRTVVYFLLSFAVAAALAAAISTMLFDKLTASRRAWLRSEHQYQTLVQIASPLAILTLDREGRVLSWNAAAERIFGWTAEEVAG